MENIVNAKTYARIKPHNECAQAGAREVARRRLGLLEDESVPAKEVQYEFMRAEPDCMPWWVRDDALMIIVRDETDTGHAFFRAYRIATEAQEVETLAKYVARMCTLGRSFLIHEVIFARNPQRIHLDIDCADIARINVDRIYASLCESARRVFGFSIPFDVYDSSGIDATTGKHKISLHIISTQHCAKDGAQAATIARRICAHLDPEDAQWVDAKYLRSATCASASSNLRICWATKGGRVKKPVGTLYDGLLLELREDWVFNDSLVANICSCETLATIPDEETIARQIAPSQSVPAGGTLPNEVVQWISENGFRIAETRAQLHGGQPMRIIRARRAMCPVCRRAHDHSNGFIFATREAYLFGCYRSADARRKTYFTIARIEGIHAYRFIADKCNLIVGSHDAESFETCSFADASARITQLQAMHGCAMIDEVIASSQHKIYFVFAHAEVALDRALVLDHIERATAISRKQLACATWREANAEGDLCLIVPVMISRECNRALASFLAGMVPQIKTEVYARGFRVIADPSVIISMPVSKHFARNGVIFDCPPFVHTFTRLGPSKRVYDPATKKTVRLRRDDHELFMREYEDACAHMPAPASQRWVSITSGRRMTFVRAPLGSGKTTALEEVIRALPAGARVVFVSPRRTYSSATCTRFAEFGFRDYRDIEGTIDLARIGRVIVQVDSLARLSAGLEMCDLLVLDEIESILSQANNCERDPHLVFEKLIYLLCHARRAIAMDGCLSEATRWLITRIARVDESDVAFIDHAGVPIGRRAQVRQVSAVCARDIGIFIADVRERADRGEHVVCVVSERRLAEALRDALECGAQIEVKHEVVAMTAPRHRVLLFTGDDFEVRAADDARMKSMFARKMEAFVAINESITREKPDVLIYTLTLTAGVDINVFKDGTDTGAGAVPYFDSFVHWFSAQVDPIEFIQATSRVRGFARNEGTLYMDVGTQDAPMVPAEFMHQMGHDRFAFANGFAMPLTTQIACFLGARKHSLIARGAQVVLRELARFGWQFSFKARDAMNLDENLDGSKSMVCAASISNADIAECALTEEHLRKYQEEHEHEARFKRDLTDPEYRIARCKCKFMGMLRATLEEINDLSIADIKALRDLGVVDAYYARIRDFQWATFATKMEFIRRVAGIALEDDTQGETQSESAAGSHDVVLIDEIDADVPAETTPIEVSASIPMTPIADLIEEHHETTCAVSKSLLRGQAVDRGPQEAASAEMRLRLAAKVTQMFAHEGKPIERDSQEMKKILSEVYGNKVIMSAMGSRWKGKIEDTLRGLLGIAGYELKRTDIRKRDGDQRVREYFYSITPLKKKI